MGRSGARTALTTLKVLVPLVSCVGNGRCHGAGKLLKRLEGTKRALDGAYYTVDSPNDTLDGVK